MLARAISRSAKRQAGLAPAIAGSKRTVYTEKQLREDLSDEWTGKNAKPPLQGAIPDHNGDILYEDGKYVRGLVLNRPSSLNALTLDMVRTITKKLRILEKNPQTRAIYLAGTGTKAFCAGGDVVWLYNNGRDPAKKEVALQFFREEYQLNYLLATAKTPIIAFMKGITMGGGVGLSVHCRYRLASDETVFAMPETQIGLIPDIGASYFLPRLGNYKNQGRGTFLGLTGHRVKGEDLVGWGLATHFTEFVNETDFLRQSFEHLVIQPEWDEIDTDDAIAHVINGVSIGTSVGHTDDLDPKFLSKYKELFNQLEAIFGPQANKADDTVEGIMERLKASDAPFAKSALQNMKRASPLSLKLTLKQLREGATLSLLDCFKMEFRIVSRIFENKDFFEGVRAQLVDKDKSPKWSPSKLSDVSDEMVNEFFKPLPEDKELQIAPHSPISPKDWQQLDRQETLVPPKNPSHATYDPALDPKLL